MANKGGAKFAEPKAPAGATAAAPADAAPAAAPAAATTTVAAAPAAAPAAAQGGAAAPALYTQTCQTCHAAGIAGAPKVGDKAAWAQRAAQGIDALTANAIKGKGAMPPKGGSSASDADIKAVVTYMVNASK
jgi:cytochrome c5